MDFLILGTGFFIAILLLIIALMFCFYMILRILKNRGEGDVPTTESEETTKATTPQKDTPSTGGTT